LPENTIQITILNDSRQEECEAGCGVDWSSLEATTLAIQRIKDRFGEEIQLEYLDLAKAKADDDIFKWNEEILKRNLSLPLLLLNNQVRISGPFDIRQLLDTIEAEIEIIV
jgi:disulfide oxidoreductase YuzD